jgi:flagellar biosynthesis regulator FlaF
LLHNHGYNHATIADSPALLKDATNNEGLFRNHGYIDATIDCVAFKRRATDNFAAEARKQDNELGLEIQKNTRGQPVKN